MTSIQETPAPTPQVPPVDVPPLAEPTPETPNPEPTVLSTGNVISVTQDTVHKSSPDDPTNPGAETVVPFAVHVDHPSGDRKTVELDSQEAAHALHQLAVFFDKLGL